MSAFFNSFLMLFAEMAPYLLLGFFLAGVLHVWVPKSLYIDKISKPNIKSVIWSALFGVPLPICSCGVIPTAIALRQEGASKGASVSFLISTPATGVDSVLATYSLMGFPFAFVRPIAALITDLIGGVLTNFATRSESNSKISVPDLTESSSHSCCSKEDEAVDHGHEDLYFAESEIPSNFRTKFLLMCRYGFVDMVANVSKWLLVGLVFGALISAFVPNDFFLGLREYPFLSMLLVLVLAMPMYTCATGSIPLALALVAKGMTPGAAFVLLMAGPATSFASMFVIGKAFGKRTLATYLIGIASGALFFGWVIDTFFMDTFLSAMTPNAEIFGAGHHYSLLAYVASAVLVLLMAYSFIPKRAKKADIEQKEQKEEKETSCSHCHKD